MKKFGIGTENTERRDGVDLDLNLFLKIKSTMAGHISTDDDGQ